MSLPTHPPLFQREEDVSDSNCSSSNHTRQRWSSYHSGNNDRTDAYNVVRRKARSDISIAHRRKTTVLLTPPMSPHDTEEDDDNDDRKYHRRELVGYDRPPAVFRKTWTPLVSDYKPPSWGSVTLKKTNNGRRVQSGISIE